MSERSGASPVPGDGGGRRVGADDEDLGGRGRGGRGRGVEVEQRAVTKPARTSVGAVFALIFGVLALFSVLIVILAPVGLIFGVIGLILGVVGLRRARRPGITGKGVATGGLVLSVVAVLLAIAFAVGVVTVLNNQSAVDRLQHQVQNLRDKLPAQVTVPH